MSSPTTCQTCPPKNLRDPDPRRLDASRGAGFIHLLVLALGITWILDGLEVTLMVRLPPVLTRPDVMHFSAVQNRVHQLLLPRRCRDRIRCLRHLTDRFGRRKFFFLVSRFYLWPGVGSPRSRGTSLASPSSAFITGRGESAGEYSRSIGDRRIDSRRVCADGSIDPKINGSFWLAPQQAR